MSKLVIFVSATIVLILSVTPLRSWASPQNSVPEDADHKEDWPSGPMDENLSVAQPPTAREKTKATSARYYPYHQALTFRAGMASDFPKISLDDSVFGFQYLFPKFLSPKLEAGADLHEDGKGHIHAGARWIYFERSYFRPSVKVALDHLMESRDGLATLGHLENYFLRTSGTLETVVWNPASLRLEPELLFNFDKVILVLTLGISWAW